MVNEFDMPNPDKEELRKMYNDSKRFPWTFDTLSGYEDYQDKYRMHAILKMVERLKPAKILDDGCGSALMGRALAQKGYCVVGFDIAESLLKNVPKLRISRLP